MSSRDIDRLARISARKPHVEMSLVFTMVWGVVACGPPLWFGELFLIENNVISLGRVGFWLTASALIAAALCWVGYVLSRAKVLAAKSDLKRLQAEMRLQRDGALT